MKPYRAGIVGAGSVSQLHLEGIRRHPDCFQVVAVMDPNEQARRQRAGEYQVPQTYADLGKMVAKADLDVAIVCTPTHIRRAVVLPLLEAGIPVFCEKPFGETYAEAAGIEEASRRLGVPVAVNQNFRRHFAFSLAKEELRGGGVGRPLHLTQQSKVCRRDTGWRNDRKRCVMSVMSIHWFDGYRWMLGQAPTSVYCRGVNSPLVEGGEDTAVSVILEFPNGTVACLSESFSTLAPMHSCALDCEKGTLDLTMKRLRVHTARDECREIANPYDKPEATFFLLDDLMRCREEGIAPETSATDNLKSMAIMEAAYRSLHENRAVAIQEIAP